MSKAQGFVPLKEIVVAGTDSAHDAVRMQESINLEADEDITLRTPENDPQARSAVNQRTVSVIIPYSKPEKIDNCIRSVTDQYYPRDLLEIIVVGKGSTNVAQRWPGVHAIDSGPIFRPGKARNLGAKAASGEVLLFLDDDCEAQENWVHENLEEVANEGVGAASGMIAGKSNGRISRAVDFANFSRCQMPERQERPLCTATFAIRKEVFEQVGGFDEGMKVHEDIDMCHRLELAGYQTIYQPRVKVLHDHGRETLGALMRYLYYGGREGGLAVEEAYPDQSLQYQFIRKLKHPLLYGLAVLPFAAAATFQAIRINLKEFKSVLALSPLIFLGKLSCHVGIWRWTIEEWVRGRRALLEFSRLIEYALLKRWIRTPRVITLFVTSQCNAKCKHCFYWENLNQNNDLSFEEIENLSRSLEKIDVLLISGGEPFLRKDLPEICELFFELNDLGQVNIPTNGLQPKKTYDQLLRILQVSKGRPVHLSLSIDGTEHVHDEIRSVPGNFKKAVETYKELLPLRDAYPNLQLRVNSTVLNRNYEDLFEFFEDHQRHFPEVNTPSLSLLRGSPFDKSYALPDIADLQLLNEHRNANVPGKRSVAGKLLDQIIFDLSLETIREETQIVPCEAGRIQGVVEDNGNVKQCEMLPPIGNLRDSSFEEIWNSPHARAEREKIVNKDCRCTHECFLYPSLLAHPAVSLKMLAKSAKGKS